MSVASSKIVSLRAFNADLGGTNPWDRQGPTPPPLPKRIAWPGGKIVSNKDVALASFLRRKLDQGQSLTPEQMAMLERMVDPNAPASAAGFAAAAGKRQKRAVGNGRGSGGGDVGGITDARNLLKRLERKVARDSDPFEAGKGGRSGSRIQKLASSSEMGRRKVDLSALKRGGQAGGSGGGGAGGRRVISDGQGGFTIATRVLPSSKGVDVARGAQAAAAGPPEVQQQWATSKRPRGVAEAEAGAAATADIPEVYREAADFFGTGGGAGKKGKHGGKAGGKGKKGGAQQKQKKQLQQQNGRGKGGTVKTKGISNVSGLAGGGAGGGSGDRSLEDLMSGGLTGRR